MGFPLSPPVMIPLVLSDLHPSRAGLHAGGPAVLRARGGPQGRLDGQD